MLMALRIILLLGAVFVIRPVGRIVGLLFIADLSHPGFLAEIGIVIYFLLGFVALVVSAVDRFFSNAWLVALGGIGFATIGTTYWAAASCVDASAGGLDYASYYCGSPMMTWGMVGISISMLLIVALRKAGLAPTPRLWG
jgi:hypothetical protein